MPRTRIDGTQVLDESIESVDIKDGEVKLIDVDAPVLDANNHSFDPTGSIFDPSIVTVGEALRNVTSIPINTLTEFESFSDATLQSTTSGGWVTKANFPYTTDTKSVGSYVIDYTASVSNSANNREVGFRAQYRLGTSGAWIDLFSEVFEFSKGGSFTPVTSFNQIEILSASVVQINIEWGQVNAATGSIKNAGIKIGKVVAAS